MRTLGFGAQISIHGVEGHGSTTNGCVGGVCPTCISATPEDSGWWRVPAFHQNDWISCEVLVVLFVTEVIWQLLSHGAHFFGAGKKKSTNSQCTTSLWLASTFMSLVVG